MADDSVSATTVINAPAEAIFAVLTDPAKHAAIDGTGWVRETLDSKPLTAAGQIFRMSMYHPNHPDGNYQVANRVQVFAPPSTISWEPGYDAGDGTLRFGGWTWRYDLTPAGPGATTSRQLDPRTPQSRSPMTGQQSRTPSESTSDSRRSLRSIWATRSPTSPNWLPYEQPALPLAHSRTPGLDPPEETPSTVPTRRVGGTLRLGGHPEAIASLMLSLADSPDTP